MVAPHWQRRPVRHARRDGAGRAALAAGARHARVRRLQLVEQRVVGLRGGDLRGYLWKAKEFSNSSVPGARVGTRPAPVLARGLSLVKRIRGPNPDNVRVFMRAPSGRRVRAAVGDGRRGLSPRPWRPRARGPCVARSARFAPPSSLPTQCPSPLDTPPTTAAQAPGRAGGRLRARSAAAPRISPPVSPRLPPPPASVGPDRPRQSAARGARRPACARPCCWRPAPRRCRRRRRRIRFNAPPARRMRSAGTPAGEGSVYRVGGDA